MTPKEILQLTSLEEFTTQLTAHNCTECTLAKEDNRGVVVHRGPTNASIMIVGEAPGLEEDRLGRPFVGPAGQLGDKIFTSIDINPDSVYWTNVCKCRPTAPWESSKQNYTPKVDQRRKCKPYVFREVELLQPKVIVALGKTAACELFGITTRLSMGMIAGQEVLAQHKDPEINNIFNNKLLFVMYHPAWILHQAKDSEAAVQDAKRKTWEHVQRLRDLIHRM